MKKEYSPSELESLCLARNSKGVSERVKTAKVTICGLGGLGSNLAIALARVGVRNLRLIDFDRVEPSNLNRQHYFIKHLDMLKSEALASQIYDINPLIKIGSLSIKLTSENIESILKDDTIICECFDTPNDKAMLLNHMAKFEDKFIVCTSGMAGFGSSNLIQTKKFADNIYICGDFKSLAVDGLMAPRVIITAMHQANMVLRIILGEYNE